MKLIVAIFVAVVALEICLTLLDWALFIAFASKEELRSRIGRR